MSNEALIQSESGGNYNATRTNDDGRRYDGRLQFGQARLTDLGLGVDFTNEEFRSTPAVQRMVEKRHWADIDNYIANNDLAKYEGQRVGGVPITRQSMYNVAHLGGNAGLKKYLQSDGAYNPSDQLGTSLRDYAKKGYTNSRTTKPDSDQYPSGKDEKYTPNDFMKEMAGTVEGLTRQIQAQTAEAGAMEASSMGMLTKMLTPQEARMQYEQRMQQSRMAADQALQQDAAKSIQNTVEEVMQGVGPTFTPEMIANATVSSSDDSERTLNPAGVSPNPDLYARDASDGFSRSASDYPIPTSREVVKTDKSPAPMDIMDGATLSDEGGEIKDNRSPRPLIDTGTEEETEEKDPWKWRSTASDILAVLSKGFGDMGAGRAVDVSGVLQSHQKRDQINQARVDEQEAANAKRAQQVAGAQGVAAAVYKLTGNAEFAQAILANPGGAAHQQGAQLIGSQGANGLGGKGGGKEGQLEAITSVVEKYRQDPNHDPHLAAAALADPDGDVAKELIKQQFPDQSGEGAISAAGQKAKEIESLRNNPEERQAILDGHKGHLDENQKAAVLADPYAAWNLRHSEGQFTKGTDTERQAVKDPATLASRLREKAQMTADPAERSMLEDAAYNIETAELTSADPGAAAAQIHADLMDQVKAHRKAKSEGDVRKDVDDHGRAGDKAQEDAERARDAATVRKLAKDNPGKYNEGIEAIAERSGLDAALTAADAIEEKAENKEREADLLATVDDPQVRELIRAGNVAEAMTLQMQKNHGVTPELRTLAALAKDDQLLAIKQSFSKAAAGVLDPKDKLVLNSMEATVTGYAEDVKEAGKKIDTIRKFQEVLDMYEVDGKPMDTGKWQEFTLPMKEYIRSATGDKTLFRETDGQALLEALSNELAKNSRVLGDIMSDKDTSLYKNMNIGLGKSPIANRILMQLTTANADRKEAALKYAYDFLLDTPEGYDVRNPGALDEYVKDRLATEFGPDLIPSLSLAEREESGMSAADFLTSSQHKDGTIATTEVRHNGRTVRIVKEAGKDALWDVDGNRLKRADGTWATVRDFE